MEKRKFLDWLLIVFVFIFLNTFPLGDFIKNTWVYFFTYSAMNIAFLVFVYFYAKKRSILQTYPFKPVKKNVLLFIPLMIVCASNFIYLSFVPSDITGSVNWTFFLYATLTVFTALKEEVIFRLLLIPNLDKVKSRFWRIIISAGIFAILHITNYLITFDPSYFIQIIYTFGLGIILGFIYEYGRSISMCIILHFLFNTINDTIFNFLAPNTSNLLIYFLVNVAVAFVAGLYLLIIYLTFLKKENPRADLPLFRTEQ